VEAKPAEPDTRTAEARNPASADERICQLHWLRPSQSGIAPRTKTRASHVTTVNESLMWQKCTWSSRMNQCPGKVALQNAATSERGTPSSRTQSVDSLLVAVSANPSD